MKQRVEIFSWRSESAQATERFGHALGTCLSAGTLILLNGELGAGKTCLATGIARGLGVDDSVPVTSPTYTLLNSYQGRLPLYHFDLYRLASEEELEDLGFDEYFHGDGVALVEWPERCPGLHEGAIQVDLSYLGEEQRQIAIYALEQSELCCSLKEALEQVVE